MKKINPSEKDVLLFPEHKPFNLSRASKFDDFKKELEEKIHYYGSDKTLLESGIECEILQPGSLDWQKGRLRLSIEFVFDLDPENSDLDKFRDH